ncbi:EthD domain-containing protein, partial [Prescottella defluvii]|uniref:EthD domain-containing protein n=1 Tax=Prescottella defluvii TaxID=1323361 RepID=UPI0012E079B4
MIKAVALLARKPDLSHDEFVAYYENNHAKLIRRLLPQIREYRRNYLDRDTGIGADGVGPPDFDASAAESARETLGGAHQVAAGLPAEQGAALLDSAGRAF